LRPIVRSNGTYSARLFQASTRKPLGEVAYEP
jgi:hypothetical protein